MSYYLGECDDLSPCVRICQLDEAGVCKGCARTGDEIARWQAAPREEKLAILDAAKARRERD